MVLFVKEYKFNNVSSPTQVKFKLFWNEGPFS